MHPRDRPYFARRKNSRRPHRFRSSLRRTHGRKLGFKDAHRLRRPRLRHLVRRRTGDGTGKVPSVIFLSMIADVRKNLERVTFVTLIIRKSDGLEYSVPTVAETML